MKRHGFCWIPSQRTLLPHRCPHWLTELGLLRYLRFWRSCSITRPRPRISLRSDYDSRGEDAPSVSVAIWEPHWRNACFWSSQWCLSPQLAAVWREQKLCCCDYAHSSKGMKARCLSGSLRSCCRHRAQAFACPSYDLSVGRYYRLNCSALEFKTACWRGSHPSCCNWSTPSRSKRRWRGLGPYHRYQLRSPIHGRSSWWGWRHGPGTLCAGTDPSQLWLTCECHRQWQPG